jgi:hypothetical protein
MAEVEMQIRLQCLQMANRSHVTDVKEIVADAQAMYDFVMDSGSKKEPANVFASRANRPLNGSI